MHLRIGRTNAYSSNEVIQRCPQKGASPTSIKLFLESHYKQNKHITFEWELVVKLHAEDVEVGISANGNLRRDQIIIERVHSPGSNVK